ncbi:sarcosine oxidase subunit gamma [Pacificoceanicola onchidii]|uniref:sarcosine oxidase subunit gamma n=1 Tax=Pacificoceanicola onchidii TaxID=2562685 RepID=UPI0010A530DA|nr:hypothetical protein [Pacificoceanicola onchidii]
MVEVRSPLRERITPGQFGAPGDAGVVLGNRTLAGLWQIAGWSDFDEAADPVLQALGLTALGSYRQAQQAAGVRAWRTAPDRMLFETPQDLTPFNSAALAVLDLGHARTCITLSGPIARDVLAQVIAVDTAPDVLKPGMFLQTGLHSVAVLVHCTGPDAFEILVPVTWAESVWDILFENALPYGIAVREAA